MLNRWSVSLGILCLLFVAAELNKPVQSDSHVITVTKEIDIGKLNENVEDLGESVQDLTKTIENLNQSVGTLNTTVEELKITVARLDERTQGTAKVQHVILASFIGPLVVAIVAPIVFYILTRVIMPKMSKDSESEAVSTRASQVIDFPREDKIMDHLKSDYRATKEKV